jgi:recombination protein RecT
MTTKTQSKKPQAGQNGAAPNLNLIKRDVVDVVGARVQEMVKAGRLQLPVNYSAGNAIMSWWLALQSCVDKNKNPALSVCTRDSIANATLDMVVQGLSPSKKQCYPVVYGKTLVCQRSYFGEEALVRRVRPEVTHVWAEVYYEGDEIEWEIAGGRRTVGVHKQKEENIGGLDKIRGCYVVIEAQDGEALHCERMTIDQIITSWKKSPSYKGLKGDSFHNEQPEEACKRTVIRRACKRLINTSDDSYLVAAVERQDMLAAEAVMDAEIEEHANLRQIDIESVDQAADELPDSEPVEIEQADATSSDPPAERFAGMVESHGMDPTNAKKLLAQIYGVDDLRKITNDMFDQQCDNETAFVKMYTTRFGLLKKETAEANTGPGW